jgi:Ferritin-like
MSASPSEQPNDTSEDLTKWKVFPRNLTARADYLVKGNPASSRPESGIGNCFPGLELDDRNLEKAFFPGLVFEFHRPDGAILYSINPQGMAAQKGLTDSDLMVTDQQGQFQRILYLWGIYGVMGSSTDGNRPEFISCTGMGGPEVWRVVHDLRPGRIIIILGRLDNVSGVNLIAEGGRCTSRTLFPDGFDSANLCEFLQRRYESGESTILRNVNPSPTDRRFPFVAFLVGDREKYLDDEGVINVESYPPGELTRTMCTPWQYDYRDCGCFYWAANKPDMVAGAQLDENNEPKYPYLNYQRRNRAESSDVPVSFPSNGPGRDFEIMHGEMFDAWNDILPVVLNDRESEQFVPPQSPTAHELMTRQQVIDELNYLAKVEHALAVEYLYAHYSLNAPEELPKDPEPDDQTKRIFAAAHEIFMIAVDEMRHLHWVNEALDLLKSPPSLGRADHIGRALDMPFALEPLTSKQLQWFIDVEMPSRAMSEGQIDGMYVLLHTSIDRQPNEFPERERLVYLIKLIIDEGGDHYHRFMSVRQHLNGMSSDTYLRNLKDAPPGSALATLQDLSDTHYATVLGILAQTFSLGDKAGGILLKNAVKEMFNLHDTNHILASKGIRPRFKLPPVVSPRLPMSAEAAHAHVDEMSTTLSNTLSSMKEVSGKQERILLARQEKIIGELFELIHKLIIEDKGI